MANNISLHSLCVFYQLKLDFPSLVPLELNKTTDKEALSSESDSIVIIDDYKEEFEFVELGSLKTCKLLYKII